MNGDELWKSNGTAAGTTMVKDIYPGANGSTPYMLTNAQWHILLFSRRWREVELWKSDGTAAGTVIVPGY